MKYFAKRSTLSRNLPSGIDLLFLVSAKTYNFSILSNCNTKYKI